VRTDSLRRSPRLVLVGLLAVGLAVACSSGDGKASGKELSAARLPRNRSDAVVFMSVGASKAQISDVRDALRRSGAVRHFAVVSSEEGLEQIRRLAPDNTVLRDADPSEIPASFHVKLVEPGRAAGFKADFENRAGVDEVVETTPQQRLDPDRVLRCSGSAPDVEVFMNLDASPEQIAAVQTELMNDPAVSQLRSVSQQEAFSQFRCLFADRPDLLEATSAEVLPASFRLELKPGADPATLNDRYSTVGGVDEVISDTGPLGR
jgi:cell division protein FtsX